MGMFLNFVQYMTGADPEIVVRGVKIWQAKKKKKKRKREEGVRFSVYSA